MKLNVYVGMRKTLNKNKKKIILEMKKNKQTNKQKKTQEFKSLFGFKKVRIYYGSILQII